MRQEFDMNVRPQAAKRRQARDQPAGPEGGHRGQVQRAAAPLVGNQLQRGRFDLPQAGADLLQITAAGLGQHQALPDPQE